MIPLDEFVFLHFGTLILALLLVKIAKLSLGKFTFLYLVLASINIVVHELLYPQEYIVGTIVSSLAGLLVVILLSGFVGTRISPMNYSTILSFIGLSPWYLNMETSGTLIITTLFVSSIYGYVQQYWAFKSLGYSWMPSLEQAKIKMTSTDYEKFEKKSHIVFVYPFLIAILLTVVLVNS